MSNSEFFQLDISITKNVYHSEQIETQLVSTTRNNTKTQDGDIPFIAVCLASISFVIVLAFFVFTISEICKFAQNKIGIFNINIFQQYPCYNCRFFKDNQYIKCAVHPADVLTKQAFNCFDYQSK
ncbi:hypothetical protein LC593_06210 [Nostoc sp. CHAB 5844]|nr:hypothetical protein [Nostoc sp. CHAB 5844]